MTNKLKNLNVFQIQILVEGSFQFINSNYFYEINNSFYIPHRGTRKASYGEHNVY